MIIIIISEKGARSVALFIFLIILGYLMGSICSAVIVCRAFNLPDPREQGSKNPGATNVLRIAGKQYAVLVMVADVLKGTIPVLIAKLLGADPVTIGFTAFAAVLGHMYPIFFEFKGGKGVATAIGAMLGFHFIIGVMVSATWLLVANFSRYSSLASIVAISLAPLYALILIGRVDIFPPLFFIALFVLFKHKDNITRLTDGTEPKIKFKHSVLDDVMETSPMTTTHEAPETIKEAEPIAIKTEKSEERIKPIKKAKVTKPKAPKPESTKVTNTTKKPAAKKPKTDKLKAGKKD